MTTKTELKRKDDRDEPRKPEIAFMLLSAATVAALIAYMVWQAVALPDVGPPRAEVEETVTTPEGDVLVRVALINEGKVGLREVQVEVKCGERPPELSFQHVPAHSKRSGTVICPPGTRSPEASVSWFIET